MSSLLINIQLVHYSSASIPALIPPFRTPALIPPFSNTRPHPYLQQHTPSSRPSAIHALIHPSSNTRPHPAPSFTITHPHPTLQQHTPSSHPSATHALIHPFCNIRPHPALQQHPPFCNTRPVFYSHTQAANLSKEIASFPQTLIFQSLYLGNPIAYTFHILNMNYVR